MGPPRKLLTKDGVVRWDEESDASLQNLAMTNGDDKVETGIGDNDDIKVKRVIHVKTETGSDDSAHDNFQHGANNETVTSIGDNRAATEERGAKIDAP